MIESFTSAGCGGRHRRRLALALFTAGALLAAAALGLALGAAGALLPGGRWPLLAVACLAFAAAAREAGLVRLPVPMLRRQVPDRWRGEWPLPAWSLGYGAGLGAGLFTYQPVATFWVACAGAVAIGRPLVSAACLAVYGLGRALLVVVPSSTRDPAAAAARLAGALPALRRANAAALTALAALLLLAPSGADATATTLALGDGRQLDPAVSDGVLAYTQWTDGATSVVVQPPSAPEVVFGGASAPALHGERLAYVDAEGVRVVNWRTGEQLARAPGDLRAPALEWPFLAVVVQSASGKRLVLSNLETGEFSVVATVGARGSLGRPSLAAGRLAWHVGDARSSRILVMTLADRSRTVVASSRIASLTHPALSPTHVAWVESRSNRSRLLLRELGSTASPRVVHTVQARRTLLWTTALDGTTAYVARWQQPTGLVQLQRVALPR